MRCGGSVAAARGAPARFRVLRHGARHLVRLLVALTEMPNTRGNWLYARDARAKVIGCLMLVLTATCLPSWPALIWCAGVPVALALSCGLSARRGFAFMAGPLIVTALMAAPAMLNVVTAGRPLWNLGGGWSVTDHGVYAAGRLVTRVAACLAAAFLLSGTTRPDRLWRGLRALGAPRLVVALLAMMHRYLDVLARVAVDMHLARISRTVGRPKWRGEQTWMAAGLAALFRRTRALAEDVHAAMTSRGYAGEMRLITKSPWRAADTALVAGLAGVCLVLWRLP